MTSDSGSHGTGKWTCNSTWPILNNSSIKIQKQTFARLTIQRIEMNNKFSCILQCGMPAPLRKEVLLVRQLHRVNVSKGSIMSKHLCIDSADHVLLVPATQIKVQYSSVQRCRNTHGYKLIDADRAFVLLTNLFGNMKEAHWELSSKNLNQSTNFDFLSKI